VEANGGGLDLGALCFPQGGRKRTWTRLPQEGTEGRKRLERGHAGGRQNINNKNYEEKEKGVRIETPPMRC